MSVLCFVLLCFALLLLLLCFDFVGWGKWGWVGRVWGRLGWRHLVIINYQCTHCKHALVKHILQMSRPMGPTIYVGETSPVAIAQVSPGV